VYASDNSLKGGLKDSTPQPIPAAGLEFGGITASSEITLDDGKSQRTLPMDVGNAPTLTISLANDPNLGTLEVEASLPGAELSLDGRPPRPLHAGPNYRGLEPGRHTIRVSKEGYEAVVRPVELKKGEMVHLGVVELKPVVRTASLVIEGATREAEVLIDGAARGVVGGDGSFKLDDLSPEAHTLTLRKADFEDKQVSKTFAVGQPVRITGADAQLTPFGTLEFRVTPQNASVTYKRAEEAQARAAENGKSVHVRAGRYAIAVTASGNRERQGIVTVEAGKPLTVDWTLPPPATDDARKAPPPPSPKQTVTKDYFRDPAAWTQDGAWWTHKGDTVSWLNGSQGIYVIELLRQTSTKMGIIKRTRRVDWVIDQKDSSNRIEYSFDFTNLDRRVIVNGKAESKKSKAPPAAASGESYELQIEISPERIVIRDARGNELDRYPRPNRIEPLGKFGFKGDVALAIKRAE
jgi:hypothetical protein